jgi:peptide/nickel transport system permease protein
VSSVIVRVTLDMAGIILTAAGLGFLGPRRAAADAGMGRHDRDRPPLPARPVVGRRRAGRSRSSSSALGFNLLGDGLRDVLDPKRGR